MDTPNIPDWLTKEFLENLLQTHEENPTANVEIISHEILSAVPKWNNYLSSILRANVVYRIDKSSEPEKKFSLIIKVPTDSNLAVINKTGIIEKELAAYGELFPKINAIIQNGQNETTLTPKFFKCNLGNIIILQDLRADGYQMLDRKTQLDFEHGALVLRNIAKFHAASVVLHEQEPEIVERFGAHIAICKNMDEELKKACDILMGEAHLQAIIDEFENWPETKRFVDFIKKLKPKFWELFIDAIYPAEGEFTVLNHGDFYCNNILFKYNKTGRLERLKFVDFQMMRYTSPAMDLLNFMYTSIPYEVLKERFYDLTKIYLDDLNRNLEKYGSSKRLNEEEFDRSMEKRNIFSVGVCINSLPYIFADPQDSDDDSKPEITPDEIMLSFIKNEKYRKTAAKYLEDFSKKPWFQNFK